MRNCRVITFNVGQGLFNLLIATRNNGSLYTAVFDCGNFQEYSLTGVTEACEILNETGAVSMLDDVVISHQDLDHWRNFLQFLFEWNGVEYSEGLWIYLPNGRTAYKYVSFSGNSVSKIDKTTSGDFHYLHSAYTKSGQGLFRGDFKNPEQVQTPDERRLRLQIGGIAMLFYFYPEDDGLWSVTMYFKATESKETKPFDELHSTCIDMIGSIIEIEYEDKLELYDILQGIFCGLLFDYEDVRDAVEGAEEFDKDIANLYLGGKACEHGYELFKRRSALFAHGECRGVNDTPVAYMKIGINADQETKDICDVLYQEKIALLPLLKKGPVYKNATSTVTAVYVSDKECLLFPGDATVHVFQFLENKLDKGTEVKLFLAPHHGSYDTNFCLNEFEPVVDEKQPLYSLLKKYPPERIFISADRKKYGHPTASFLRICGELCRGKATKHKILCGPDDWNYKYEFKDSDVYETERAIFCTESSEDNLYFELKGQEEEESVCANGQRNAAGSAREKVREKWEAGSAQLPPDSLFIPYGGFDI